jgi:hypothetical protein
MILEPKHKNFKDEYKVKERVLKKFNIFVDSIFTFFYTILYLYKYEENLSKEVVKDIHGKVQEHLVS